MFSLIVATVDRVTELNRLLDSLESQTLKDFEVIIVDQNHDDRSVPVIREHNELAVRHLRSVRGLSRARNVGLTFAKGGIIAFPDDDCWYPDHLLASVGHWFEQHAEFSGLFTCLRDGDNNRIGSQKPAAACLCTRTDLWDRGSPSCFLRRALADSVGLFDEKIGLGSNSPYQAGEDADYFLRAYDFGHKMLFEPGLTVHHPPLSGAMRLHRNTYSYALASGFVFRAHRYPIAFVLAVLSRSLGGAMLSLGRLDLRNTRTYIVRAAGLLCGYLGGSAGRGRTSRQTH
jgi:glycosyltransferase involved in cell wall biosynthesis